MPRQPRVVERNDGAHGFDSDLGLRGVGRERELAERTRLHGQRQRGVGEVLGDLQGVFAEGEGPALAFLELEVVVDVLEGEHPVHALPQDHGVPAAHEADRRLHDLDRSALFFEVLVGSQHHAVLGADPLDLAVHEEEVAPELLGLALEAHELAAGAQGHQADEHGGPDPAPAQRAHVSASRASVVTRSS